MSRAAVLAWLDTRRPTPPATLRAHIAAAVPELEAALPEHLVTTGARLLARVSDAPGGAGRDLALDLLAADAFVTYAFEAQAEADIDGLAAFAARVARGEITP